MIRRNMQPTRIGALTMSGVAFTKGWIRTYPDRVDNATSRQVLKITTMLACQAWAPQRVNMALDFDSSCERKGIGVVSCSYGGMRSSAAICACAERERRKGAGAHLTLGRTVAAAPRLHSQAESDASSDWASDDGASHYPPPPRHRPAGKGASKRRDERRKLERQHFHVMPYNTVPHRFI